LKLVRTRKIFPRRTFLQRRIDFWPQLKKPLDFSPVSLQILRLAEEDMASAADIG
jgi:hypothetical protein